MVQDDWSKLIFWNQNIDMGLEYITGCVCKFMIEIVPTTIPLLYPTKKNLGDLRLLVFIVYILL